MLAAEGRMPATSIYRHFKASAPAISQHLQVLKQAKLVGVQKKAQQRIYYVNPEPMKEFERWIKRFTAKVDKQYQKLDALLETEKAKLPIDTPEQQELFR
jgi:DNA-binding transcriptional regulator GbsR (MarR family)